MSIFKYIKEYLECIINCLYKFIFKFGQFLDFKFAYLPNYWRFCDFDTSKGHFLSLVRNSSLFEAKYFVFDINECLKCIIKCLYQFVFKFGKYLDFKCTYLLNYWRFSDFDTSKGHFLALVHNFSLFDAK